MQDRFESCRAQFAHYRQDHVFRFWGELTTDQRAELLHDAEQVDLARCAALIDPLVLNKPAAAATQEIRPPEVLPAVPDSALAPQYAKARAQGENLIRDGKVAAFTVAGGQGTRLGFAGPKGCFGVSPIRNASLFQWFAEGLLGVRRRYGAAPRWYIMTSPSNHASTLAWFDQHDYFGLPREGVVLFQQRQMPAFERDGRIAMTERYRLALSPDGHGGSLWALAQSGALADMQRHGVAYISYFQVDNPLVQIVDPLMLGLHAQSGSEMSSKAVHKAHDLERVGNFCLANGQLQIIEYSDLPQELAVARTPDGARLFDAGSIAVHVLDRAFVERLTRPGSGVALPWHRADKKADIIDERGARRSPASANVVKLEMFVFDAIPLAQRPLVMYAARAEEFSPVKNADGADSPATARRDLVRRAARWLGEAGVHVPFGKDGEPRWALEISPAFALCAGDLQEQLQRRGLPQLSGPTLFA